MVAYNFEERFVEPIEAGTKTQTLRAVGRRKHAKYGDSLQLYCGMRTKHCRKIIEPDPICSSRADVVLKFEFGEIVDILIGSYKLPVEDLDRFAVKDGFADVSDMTDYWHMAVPEMVGFSGDSEPLFLISWGGEPTWFSA